MNDIQWWLMKSEPDAYGIDQLQKEGVTLWDGIRNYQARNFMRSMKVGDQAFFYHSNCKPPGIVGMMKVSKIGLVDPTQFDVNSKYYDPKSSKEKPRWDCVEMRYLSTFDHMLSLEILKTKYTPDQLKVVSRGNRLSIIPVSKDTACDLIQMLS